VKQATWTKQDGTKQEVAVKCIQKKLVSKKPQVVYDEMDVLKKLDSPHIVKIYDWFESKDKYFLVFELIEGGELFDAIVQRHHFSEHDAAVIISSVLGAVEYLHGNNICHRDLKPENLLLREKHPTHLDQIVICDFGVARHLSDGVDLNRTLVGSPGYSAPELQDSQGYKGQPADIWSLGVIAYALLSGTTPFRNKGDDAAGLLREQMTEKLDFSRTIWNGISEQAKDFITRCCKVEPKERMTAAEALAHPWIQHECHRSTHDIGAELRPALSRTVIDGGGSKYNARRPLENHEQELSPDSSDVSGSESDASDSSATSISSTNETVTDGFETDREIDGAMRRKMEAVAV